MGATLTVQFGVRKGSVNPGFLLGIQYSRNDGKHLSGAAQGRFYATTGMPISASGRNESEDVTLAAKNALLSMIEYLVEKYCFTREQAYAVRA